MAGTQELMTVGDAARIVEDLGPDGVRAACERGELPFVSRTPRGVYLISRDAVAKFIERREARRRLLEQAE